MCVSVFDAFGAVSLCKSLVKINLWKNKMSFLHHAYNTRAHNTHTHTHTTHTHTHTLKTHTHSTWRFDHFKNVKCNGKCMASNQASLSLSLSHLFRSFSLSLPPIPPFLSIQSKTFSRKKSRTNVLHVSSTVSCRTFLCAVNASRSSADWMGWEKKKQLYKNVSICQICKYLIWKRNKLQ